MPTGRQHAEQTNTRTDGQALKLYVHHVRVICACVLQYVHVKIMCMCTCTKSADFFLPLIRLTEAPDFVAPPG